MERTATHSMDYVQRHADRKPLSNEQKKQKLAKIWSADPSKRKSAAIQRIGQGMIGPIQIKLRYEGFVRNILVEDTLERGPIQPYEVLDDLGQAYILNATEAEVKSTPFEGKQVYPQLFRVASFPFVRKEDLFLLRANIIEHAQDETRQAIMKQEDGRLLTLMSSAITDYGSEASHLVTPDHIVEIGAGNPLDVVDFYDAISRVELHEMEVNRILINPADLRDLYTWDVNVTGWAFKDRVFGGESITEFGEFVIQKSIMVPQGTIYLVPDPNWLGVMPVMYSLDVEENNQVEQFHRGWVMDELIGMMILNPRGLASIKKV